MSHRRPEFPGEHIMQAPDPRITPQRMAASPFCPVLRPATSGGRPFRSRLVAACIGAVAWLPLGAGATDATKELSDLKARLEAQRRQLDEQRRQLAAQEEQLRAQERTLNELSTRMGAGAAVGAPTLPTSSTSPSPAAQAPAPSQEATRQGLGQPVEIGPPSVSSRFGDIKVYMGGALRTTVNTTTARMQPDATPFFVLPKVNGVADGTTKIDARLSSLFFSIDGAKLGDFKLGGSIYAYLFDGDLLSGKYGFYPGFAYIDAVSDRWRFAAGLQMDIFSPMIPTMVDRMSAFAGSGNPGNSFKPQLRAEHMITQGRDRIVLQGALADAVASNIKPPSNANPLASSIENTGLPNFEARVAWTRGAPGEANVWLPWAEYTLGLSGATGNYRTFSLLNAFSAYDTRLSGVAIEGAWRITPRFGVQGELYAGRALGQYLATIFQSTNSATGQAISSKGGWAEAAWYWTPRMHSHLGYGQDKADANDVPVGGFLSNRTAFLNLFWDPSPKTTLAIEGTWRKTGYRGLGDYSGYSLMLSSELRF
jgi:hypothetical protein